MEPVDNFNMPPSDAARRLKSIRSRAIGLRELARAIGWDASRYQYYEDSFKKPRLPREFVDRIKPHIVGKGDPPVTPSELDALADYPPGSMQLHGDVRGAVIDTRMSPPLRSEMVRDIPILGTVSGGPGGLHQMNGDAIDWARRPPRLAGRTDVFGAWVEDPSMIPAYRPGALILVERARPPAPGDDVVIELRAATARDDQRALIKHLVAVTSKVIRVAQYNPPKELEFDRRQVIHMYRVMPLADLLGV